MATGEEPESSATTEQRLIGGRYRLTERLGAGGMGTVWAGWDTLVDREVAVKQALTASAGPLAARILREARAAARVEHPAVVTVHDVVVEDGYPWIVMERVHGESLADRLDHNGALPEREAARIGMAVTEALAAAHARGVLHRDVKPGNVLLGSGGRVVLTDFGIAYIVGEESLTQAGEFVGSLAYTAPERMGGQRPGPASDMWSLGVLLYEMVEATSPFRRASMEATVGAVLAGKTPPLHRAVALAPLIKALLVTDPAARPAAQAVIEALRATAGSAEPVRKPAVTRSQQRMRWAAALLSTAAVAVLTLPLLDRFDDSPSSPLASAPPTPTNSRSSSQTGAKGYEHVSQPGFELEVSAGWRHHDKNASAQYRYTRGEYELIVVPGRDAVANYAKDLMIYQRDYEPELQPYRDSTWATSSGLTTIKVSGYRGVRGQFTWEAEGKERFVLNRALNIDGRIHLLVATGPEAARDTVSRFYDHAAKTYKPAK
ncbi:serine/threonine protein kinase [Streptomyces sp. NBC_01635]|uniref:serine/threonine-protein kinase n=1 Tax=Streptomyces sp. NBC_01635 TaxID=2975904 RepID=UPI003864133B|nr:serine/threonine protein kinase [Streptomyces sp. NBC_01635]